MASKPRPSLLDLFDPLLADAVRVPIPESPPMTPQKTLERGVENKENQAPKELTMSVFFNRISRNTSSPDIKATTSLSSGLLVDLEDAEVWSGNSRTQVSPRVPLTELSVDDFPLPTNFSLTYGSSHQKNMSQNPSSLPETMPLPPSPLHQTQLASSPLPAISETNSCHFEGSIMPTTHSQIGSVLPQILEPPGESLLTSSSKGLLLIDNSPGKQFHRRSSIDISATLSSVSSSSFYMPDASFDLVNGEISFLAKTSEEFDVDHDVHVDSWESETPRASPPPQILISEQSPLDLSKTNKHSSDNTFLTTTSTQPLTGHANISSESQLAHRQPALPSGCTRITDSEPFSTPALDTINTGGQDTPPSTRRVSSVPAPIKKLKVFTSKHQQTANKCAKRESARMAATSSGASYLSSKIPPQESAVGCGTSCISGIPRGNAARDAVVGDTVEQHKGKPVVSGVKTSTKGPSRTVRYIEVSGLHKDETANQSSHVGAVSRLPAPAGVRGGTVASQRRYGRSESTQRGRSIPVRSTLPLASSSSKEANRITER